MSALGHERAYRQVRAMSALPPITDVGAVHPRRHLEEPCHQSVTGARLNQAATSHIGSAPRLAEMCPLSVPGFSLPAPREKRASGVQSVPIDWTLFLGVTVWRLQVT